MVRRTMYMSVGPWNSVQSSNGNFFLYHRMFHCATSHQTGRRREGCRTYANPDHDDDDGDAAEERGLGCQLYKG
jgi:hypothetical protein